MMLQPQASRLEASPTVEEVNTARMQRIEESEMMYMEDAASLKLHNYTWGAACKLGPELDPSPKPPNP